MLGMLRRLTNGNSFKLRSYSKLRLYAITWDIWYLTLVHTASFHNALITNLTDQDWSLVRLA